MRLRFSWCMALAGAGLSAQLLPNHSSADPDATIRAAAPAGQSGGPDSQARQLARGEDVYFANCSMCHNDDLSGGAGHAAPPLAGAGFLAHWAGHSAWELFDRVRTTMPEGAPRTLDDQAYLDVVAFLLASNKMSLGTGALNDGSARQLPIPAAQR